MITDIKKLETRARKSSHRRTPQFTDQTGSVIMDINELANLASRNNLYENRFMIRYPKKKVFVSFDFENDKQYKYLLEAWDANDDFDFVFSDKTPTEINSDNIGRIKAGLTAKKRVTPLHPCIKICRFRKKVQYLKV